MQSSGYVLLFVCTCMPYNGYHFVMRVLCSSNVNAVILFILIKRERESVLSFFI